MSKNKVLVVTTVASTIDQFCMNDINILLELNSEVHIIANFEEGNNTSKERLKEFKKELLDKGIVIHESKLNRNPINMNNLKQYKEIKKLINKENFKMIHCHTPIASIITRLAAKKSRKSGTKVIYTAHGLHFFKGAPIINWIMYFPLEKLCSYFTDVLITINMEDYNLVKKKLSSKNTQYIPGIGIDTYKFKTNTISKKQKCLELNIPSESKIILSVGELNNNKNHRLCIKALEKLNDKNIHYFIAGKGELEMELINLSNKLKVSNQVHLLGYRTDIRDLYSIADVFCFPSYREGLSVALMEAMSIGVPVVCSKIRGNVDLIQNNLGGYLCNVNSVEEFENSLKKLIYDKSLCEQMSIYNREFIKNFDVKIVEEKMREIYGVVLYGKS